MLLRSAQATDLSCIVKLLNSSSLPCNDLELRHLAHFIVLHDDQAIMGCAGIECYGKNALLRSVAVHPTIRNSGWGRQLTKAMENHAQDIGVTILYLLTTSATSFFERQGYRIIDRIQAPYELRATTQFSSICPASATCMQKDFNLIKP
jgi:amino-acid N-acetyltransferase